MAPRGAKSTCSLRRQISSSMADEVRVEQIIWNLLTNAIKFTEPGGRIDVAVSREDDTALFTVTDDGAGISPETAARHLQAVPSGDDGLGRSRRNGPRTRAGRAD